MALYIHNTYGAGQAMKRHSLQLGFKKIFSFLRYLVCRPEKAGPGVFCWGGAEPKLFYFFFRL